MPRTELEHGVTCDLSLHERELASGDSMRRDGHAARTLVRENDLRVVLITMRSGARIAEHLADATVMIHLLKGKVRLHLGGKDEHRAIDLEPAQLLALPKGLAHDLEAIVESSVLVTLGWHPKVG